MQIMIVSEHCSIQKRSEHLWMETSLIIQWHV
jgi:hypothetical protein